MRNAKLKKFLISGLIVASAISSASAWSQVRPLIKKSAEECNPTYLEAIKPTPEETDKIFAIAIRSIFQSLYKRENLNNIIAGSERNVRIGAVNREFQEKEIVLPALQRIKETDDQIDQCWTYANGLKPSQEALNRALLYTANQGKDYRMTIGLVGRLVKKGASIDGSLPNSTELFTGLFFDRSSGALFPLMVNGLMEGKPAGYYTEEQSRQRLEQRLDFIRILIAKMTRPSTINSRAVDTRTGPTALEYAVIAGNDQVINLLMDSGADPRIVRLGDKGKPEKTLIDLYGGKDMNVVKRLSGGPQPFNRPNFEEVLERILGRSDFKTPE